MKSYYDNFPKHFVALDCIIFGFDEGELKLLVVKRDLVPARGQWSLMGGFLELNENLKSAAQRILHNLTGLKNVFMEQLFTFGEVDRDPGERTVSVAYFALLKIEDYDKDLVSLNSAQWFPMSEVPELIFDHNTMVNKALKRLRRKARVRPIGFELLPKKFTLPQLQSLYEAIYNKTYDKRNFRKKILSTGLLVKHEEKDKLNSRKGAFLYSFDKKKYKVLANEGFNFEI
ncbi:NUDIX domain-containing protein [Bacteroidota bacterium]